MRRIPVRPFALLLVLVALAMVGLTVHRAGAAESAATMPSAPTFPPLPPIGERRVLIISIDGLRPDVLLRADAPRLRSLMKEGSFTFWAQTTAVAVTLPSHVSMLTGVTPQQHRIEWNRDLEFKEPVYPAVPTIFDLAHAAGMSTGMAVGKSKFSVLGKPGVIHDVYLPDEGKVTDAIVAKEAVRILREKRPRVMFVHLPDVDTVGHSIGWGTPEQVAAAGRADAAVGEVLNALDEKARVATLVIVSADHGGAGRGHGPDDARSRHIPWIASGPGISTNLDLTLFSELNVRTEDTFATACDYLGLTTRAVVGKPVKQIYATR